jgi:phytoene dehydrogenase-like protein
MMAAMPQYDAVVVGAGPNGLTAAAVMASAGRRVLVLEQADAIGGGTRTEEMTLPGYLHDICSAIHPLGAASPAFAELALDIEWVHPEIPLAHPLGGGRAGALLREVPATAASLGPDATRYGRIMEPLVDRAGDVIEDFLGPLQMIPSNPGTFVRLASRGALPAATLISAFASDEARALLSGLAAHAIAPFSSPLTGGVMLLFAVAGHAYGWPMARGGSRQITDRLARMVLERGGRIETRSVVKSLDDLPPARAVLLDLMPEHAARIAGARVTARHQRGGHRGPAVFKVDWALDGPIPWLDELSTRAGTVHVGGTFEEVAAAEQAVHQGQHPERPFVFVAQQSLFDATRAPEGGHTAWGYCHVPTGSDVDMTGAIEGQIERFAPGFRDRIVARATMNATDFESHNPNYIDATSPGVDSGCARCSSWARPGPTGSATGSTCARRPLRPEPAFTGCAATTRLGPPWRARARAPFADSPTWPRVRSRLFPSVD